MGSPDFQVYLLSVTVGKLITLIEELLQNKDIKGPCDDRANNINQEKEDFRRIPEGFHGSDGRRWSCKS